MGTENPVKFQINITVGLLLKVCAVIAFAIWAWQERSLEAVGLLLLAVSFIVP
jgi:hypothetical protein